MDKLSNGPEEKSVKISGICGRQKIISVYPKIFVKFVQFVFKNNIRTVNPCSSVSIRVQKILECDLWEINNVILRTVKSVSIRVHPCAKKYS